MEVNSQCFIKPPTEELNDQMNKVVFVNKLPTESPTNIYKFIDGNITKLDDGNGQAFQRNVCRESEVSKKHMNDSIKRSTEELIDLMKKVAFVNKLPTESPTNIYKFRVNSNGVLRREIGGNITKLDDENGQAFQGNVCRESKVDKTSMNDLQEIQNAVVDLVSHGVYTNLPSATMTLLRTLMTLIRQKMDNLIDKCEESVTCKKRTAKIPPANVGMKRVRDVDECTVEKSVIKKQKTKHECNKHNERSTTTSISSLMERNTANISTENYLKTMKTSEPTATTRNENHNIQIKKFEYSRLVVNELRPHYDRNYFATTELFQFMTKSIVHRLLDATVYPGEYTIKMKIRQMMPNAKIESEVQILKLLKPFF